MTNYIPIIALDGPSGSGKGVVANFLSTQYKFHLLDSGALYRLVGIAARRSSIELENPLLDEALLGEIARSLDVTFTSTNNPEDPLEIRLSGEQVAQEVRTDAAGVDASLVATLPAVRDGLFELQRSFRQLPGLVADGRDMGTGIFPEADVKIYLTASAKARAKRRYNQLIHKGISVSMPDLFQSILARDERDMNRAVSPLKPAEDAFVIDSTDMDIEEVLRNIEAIVTEKLGWSRASTP
jgi:cytidylate kinase